MASRNLGQAGSPACRIWFSLSSGTNRASGMSRANSRPCSFDFGAARSRPKARTYLPICAQPRAIGQSTGAQERCTCGTFVLYRRGQMKVRLVRLLQALTLRAG